MFPSPASASITTASSSRCSKPISAKSCGCGRALDQPWRPVCARADRRRGLRLSEKAKGNGGSPTRSTLGLAIAAVAGSRIAEESSRYEQQGNQRQRNEQAERRPEILFGVPC